MISSDPIDATVNFPWWPACSMGLLFISLIFLLIGIIFYRTSRNATRLKTFTKYSGIAFIITGIVFGSLSGFVVYSYFSQVPDWYIEMDIEYIPNNHSAYPGYPEFSIYINDERYNTTEDLFLKFEHEDRHRLIISTAYLINGSYYPANFIEYDNLTVIDTYYNGKNLTFEIIGPKDTTQQRLYYFDVPGYYRNVNMTGTTGSLRFHMEIIEEMLG